MSKREIVAVILFKTTLEHFAVLRRYLKANSKDNKILYSALAPNKKNRFTIESSNPRVVKIIDSGYIASPLPEKI